MFTRPKIWVRFLFGIIALILIAGGGIFLFRLGYSQGAISVGGEALTFSEMPNTYGYNTPMLFHRGPFGGVLIGLFFLMLFLGMTRRAMWGRRWAMSGRHGMHGMHGGFGFGKMEEMHAELHKRMDEAPSEDASPTTED